MSCEELRDHYELYALGIADAPEREEIQAHLERHCETCEAGLRSARELAVLLGGTAEPASPSPKLRRRILACVSPEPQRVPWWALWAAGAVAAAALIAAVIAGGRERDALAEAARSHSELSGQASELARLNEAFAILNGPDTTEASFGQGQPRPPRGRVFLSPGHGVLLVASNLPPAPSGRTYEMWIIPKGGNPVPAGLFQSQTDGSAMHVQPGSVNVQTTGAVAVTLENAGGAPQPTSQPLIVAMLASPGAAR